MEKLSQLNDLYNHIGWKHLEEWIHNEISTLRNKVENLDTPKEEAERSRLAITSYRKILDKVESDKQMNKQAKG